jgi:hypothetical protein
VVAFGGLASRGSGFRGGREKKSVQEGDVGGPALRAVLGAESEEHDAAAADPEVHERRSTVKHRITLEEA